MKTYFETLQPLTPGKVCRIIQRDSETGNMVGSWDGYYDPKRFVVRLYPNANPFCHWKVSREARKISASLVRLKR